ncbi:MAG: hypothetical protein E7483_02925, partial [Ruminococcaceae bacterium]|nr:hypothetical protein [Oscillospiraceae bacterium]
MDRYKITQDEVMCNNVKSAPTYLKGEDPAANKHIFDKLPELIVEKFNRFVDGFNTMVDEKLAEHDIMVGAGDMLRAVYDTDYDGIVDNTKRFDGHSADYFATKTELETAQTTADNAMAKAGGEFSGDVAAYNENRATSSLRNIEVRITDTAGELQATNKIIM